MQKPNTTRRFRSPPPPYVLCGPLARRPSCVVNGCWGGEADCLGKASTRRRRTGVRGLASNKTPFCAPTTPTSRPMGRGGEDTGTQRKPFFQTRRPANRDTPFCGPVRPSSVQSRIARVGQTRAYTSGSTTIVSKIIFRTKSNTQLLSATP